MVEQVCNSFFERNGLSANSWQICHDVARRHFPKHEVQVSEKQGYCSYTIVVERSPSPDSLSASSSTSDSTSRVLQFRPGRFKLDSRITHEAKRVYGIFAPEAKDLGVIPFESTNGGRIDLHVYDLERIRGTPFGCLLSPDKDLSSTPLSFSLHVDLIKSFARFIVCSWPSSFADFTVCSHQSLLSAQHNRRDSLLADESAACFQRKALWADHPLLTGTIGAKIATKLQRLATDLPTPALRAAAQAIYNQLGCLKHVPVVLNHGDMVPGNIIIDPSTGTLNGFVDWAEAEYLPFGTCFYGLEYLLGCVDDQKGQFTYWDRSEELQRSFWQELEERIPDLKNEETRRAVGVARDVGVLLWFGYAWDEGAIDRVVGSQDDRELMLLRTFLGVRDE